MSIMSKIYFFKFLSGCFLHHAGSYFPNQDRTHTPCSGSMES